VCRFTTGGLASTQRCCASKQAISPYAVGTEAVMLRTQLQPNLIQAFRRLLIIYLHPENFSRLQNENAMSI
jgi:hypothetical protein